MEVNGEGDGFRNGRNMEKFGVCGRKMERKMMKGEFGIDEEKGGKRKKNIVLKNLGFSRKIKTFLK